MPKKKNLAAYSAISASASLDGMEEPILDIRGLLQALMMMSADIGGTEGEAVYRVAAVACRRLDEVENHRHQVSTQRQSKLETG